MTENEKLYLGDWKDDQDAVEVFLSNNISHKGTIMCHDDEVIVLRMKSDRSGGGYCYRDVLLYKRWVSTIMSLEPYVLEGENGK